LIVQVIETPSELRRASRRARIEGVRVALVPTMGALHEGHLSLVRCAREHADRVVMSVFVNPTQFGPGEDFESYPRDFDRDRQLAEGAGVDILFHPAVEAFYPPGNATRVEVEGLLGDGLCGRTRPEHFRGVTTVVAKLLLASEPDVAVFGRKDYQQWRILERMAADLLLEVEVVGAPIVREPDGLALSSRNRYLSVEEREAALALPRALSAGADAVSGGERNPGRVVAVMREVLAEEPLARADYLEVVNAEDLQPLQVLQGSALLAGAAHVGATRLIDNREIII
jgi:pantoate--beta-alanine ligase